MNWKIFELKYDKREQWAFEQMSYLLFCAEFNNRVGLFRYKNQTGIETEPLEKDNVSYGFQAKYYTTSLSKNKSDIIDSIKKAKTKNNQLNEIFFYLNKELSESTIKNKKQPQYQIDIENTAQDIGIKITWRVLSHFELQLSLPENKYIYDLFFNLEPNAGDLLEAVNKHNINILKAIQTEILCGDKKIKINRMPIIKNIRTIIREKQNLIISGEGGSGKTAIFKDFYKSNYQEIPICIFKASELNVNQINDLFHFDNKFSFQNFLDVYRDEPIKYFVIDSAEKLAEISDNDILNNLIQMLLDSDWNLIFTTRYSYLNDLSFQIQESYNFSFKVIDIPLISTEKLKTIAKDYKFTLPENQKFLERLINLFYLNEYVKYYSNINKQGDFYNFIDLLWKKRIQKNLIQKDNLHIEREKCIIDIVKERCKTGKFYINADNLPQQALFQLKLDEIIGYDDNHAGYFITHDIYEEWTLNKIVSRIYKNKSDSEEFFEKLGNSLPIRRAFRIWLSDQLSEHSKELETFIFEAFENNSILQFWKDEMLVSILLSNFSEEFFKICETDIIADDFKILKRIIFLLRIACSDISASKHLDTIKPKGKGWESVIALIYKYKAEFLTKNINVVLPILIDWCYFYKKGTTTRLVGLLAISVLEEADYKKGIYIHDNIEEKFYKVIYNTVKEIKPELRDIINSVLAQDWTHRSTQYKRLCSKILEKPYLALEVIKLLPLSVIELCKFFWQKPVNINNGYDFDGMESKYGLVNTYSFNYFPASAYQTPIYWLLQHSFNETLEFIISFTNRSVEIYSQSDYGIEDVDKIKLHINDKEIPQFSSLAIWEMYRGMGSPVVPYLLQSIHMALEKILLEFSQIAKPEIIKSILLRIIINSKSTSLTAVVCSIVIAEPNKYYDIATILFNTLELFHLDGTRCFNEFQVLNFRTSEKEFYAEERDEAKKAKHRNSDLEWLFLKYQYTGIEGFSDKQNSEFINKLYKIIDNHKSDLSTLSNTNSQKFGILLARMDRRNLVPNITKTDDNKPQIKFDIKELSDELREESENVNRQFDENYKYTSLHTWSDFLIGKNNQNISPKQVEYNNNPLIALSETKQLVKELHSRQEITWMFEYAIPSFSCSKLMIEYKELLSKDDKEFCKEIILESVNNLLSDNYGYQISDGVEASLHALPSLINEYPNESETFIRILILSIFDTTPLGEYKRICDYVFESIHESKLWEQFPTISNIILFGYIKFKPFYAQIKYTKKNLNIWNRIPKSLISEEFNKRIPYLSLNHISFDITDINSFDVHDFEKLYQLIPSNTIDTVHYDIYKKSLALIVPQLLMDNQRYREESGDESFIYKIRNNIFERFAYFILQRDIKEIDLFLKPFIDSFNATEESTSFLGKLISVQHILKKREQFWYIWNCFYPKIIEICNEPVGHHLDDVIINYLLAWNRWINSIEEWHSLRDENSSFYTNISQDLGHIPSVLYSISRVLNTIGKKFTNDGLTWTYNVISTNPSLRLREFESSTLYYLENFIRKFIFINKQKIKKDVVLKRKVIEILSFMIERGSIHGYLQRESIL